MPTIKMEGGKIMADWSYQPSVSWQSQPYNSDGYVYIATTSNTSNTAYVLSYEEMRSYQRQQALKVLLDHIKSPFTGREREFSSQVTGIEINKDSVINNLIT